MSFLNKIRENWAQLTFLGVVLLALVGTYVQVRVSAIAMAQIKSDAAVLYINKLIDTKLSSVDIATDSKIVDMDQNISTNTNSIASVKESGEVTQRQLEAVGRILMKPPVKVPDG